MATQQLPSLSLTLLQGPQRRAYGINKQVCVETTIMPPGRILISLLPQLQHSILPIFWHLFTLLPMY